MATELAKATEYAIVRDADALSARLDIYRENLGAGGMTLFDLPRAKIPSGGATVFQIPTLEGKPLNREHITGVIVGFKDGRVYWKEQYGTDGGQQGPPDCASDDLVLGVGDPGGVCAKCPNSKFGTKGRAQACQQRRALFVVEQNNTMPTVVNLPPTSLKACREYMIALANASVPYWQCITEIGLTQEKSGAGIMYAATTFRMVDKFTSNGGHVAAIGKYRASFLPVIGMTSVAHVMHDGNSVDAPPF